MNLKFGQIYMFVDYRKSEVRCQMSDVGSRKSDVSSRLSLEPARLRQAGRREAITREVGFYEVWNWKPT